MGSKPSSQQSTSQTFSPPPQVLANYQAVTQQAQNVAATPYNQYTGQLVAPVNAQQSTGIGGINAASGIQTPYNQAAGGLALESASTLTPQAYSSAGVNQYYSPYVSDVVNATQAQFNNQNAQQSSALLGQGISAGNAFGGDREGVAQAALAGQQQLAEAPVIANLENQGFQQAQQEFNTQQQTALQAAQQNNANRLAASQALSGLGNTAQQEAINEATAQVNAGTLQQQTQQAQDTAAYNQYLQKLAYPFQTTGWLANIVEGIGSQSGGTSSGVSTTESNNTSGLIGAGLGLLSFLDRGGAVREKRAAGGGIGGAVGSMDPWSLDMAEGQVAPGSGGIVPAINLAIGHTMPTGQMQTSPQQQQSSTGGLPSIQSGLQGLSNSSLGDSVSDFMQDTFGFERGGGVRPHRAGGGNLVANPAYKEASMAGQLATSGRGPNTGQPQPYIFENGGPSPAASAPSHPGAASYAVFPVQNSDGSWTTTQNITNGVAPFKKGGRVHYDDGGDVGIDPMAALRDAMIADQYSNQMPTVGGGISPSGSLGAYRASIFDPNTAAADPSSTAYAEPIARGIAPPTNQVFADRIQDLQQDAADAGIPSVMISGTRTNDLQRKLYANFQAKNHNDPLPFPEISNGGLAAPPGSSLHEYGEAADVLARDPAQQGALNAMAAEPWRGITPGATFGDPDHYQLAGASPARATDPQDALAFGDQPRGGVAPAVAAINRAAPPPGVASGEASAPAATQASDQGGLGFLSRLFGGNGAPAGQNRSGLIGLNLSDQERLGLLAAGLGIMAGKSLNPWQNIGEGGLAGIKAMQGAAGTTADVALKQAQASKAMTEAQIQERQLQLMMKALEDNQKLFSDHADNISDRASTPGQPAPTPTEAIGVKQPVTAQNVVGTPGAAGERPASSVDPLFDPRRLMAEAQIWDPINPAKANAYRAQAQSILGGQSLVRFNDGSYGYFPGVVAAKTGEAGATTAAQKAAENAAAPTIDPGTGAAYVGGSGGDPVPTPLMGASAAPSNAQPAKPFAIDPETAKVQSSVPQAPPGGGYIVPNLPPGAKLTKLPATTEEQIKTDQEFLKDQIATARTTDTAISRAQALAQAFKTFQSGSFAEQRESAAAIAQTLGYGDIAKKIMNGSVDGAQWVNKEGVNSVLDTLKQATPRFAQSEFNAIAAHGTPNTTNQPQANHEMVAEMLAIAERNNDYMKDWEKAKQQGWSSPSAFYTAWRDANPLNGYIKSAQRQIGNFDGMDLPAPQDWTAGAVYVAPKKLPPATGALLGKYGVKPGDIFVYNGRNSQGAPIRVVPRSEYFSTQLGQ